MKLLYLLPYPLLFLLITHEVKGARKGGRKKGKGKMVLPFPNVEEFSMVLDEKAHPTGAKITRASHFAQTYKLGYKLVLICIAEGKPVPHIKWYRDGMELELKDNVHIFETRSKIEDSEIMTLKSKIEVDPAAVGDQGIYTCMASNQHAGMAKNFKTEYIF